MTAFLDFLMYFATAAALLAVFVWIYVSFTPYREFELIRQNNQAAAIALAGAVIGFAFPLVSSIYYTRSLLEMVLWAALTCLTQMAVFMVLRRQVLRIGDGDTAPAIMLAAFSIAIGMIDAVCISH